MYRAYTYDDVPSILGRVIIDTENNFTHVIKAITLDMLYNLHFITDEDIEITPNELLSYYTFMNGDKCGVAESKTEKTVKSKKIKEKRNKKSKV